MRVTLPSNIIVSKAYWEKQGHSFNVNSLLLGIESNKNQYTTLDDFKELISKNSQIEAMKDTFASADAVVYILILGAIVLGTTVIYNLGLLNYSEMMRDYATLKVLGFYPGEIRLLSFKENSFLYVIGWLLVIPAGQGFLKIYMGVLSNDSMIFFLNLNLQAILLLQ
ncbi:hypothetical protein AZF37_08730 [endosymbiont 'TC1' of Trimyema compressum]|uniref:FtsX-like permease family protein n=1 Tax=endosymbiont 'TC1' of Trimyema compressum TaxID=243899 RepID=UPI0007F10E3E|nr:ABC transporter permease [endosymbiont 'TC1' of Trimyema compressum]AMP21223.1 hypothetical protein AZF37_08730 [endosymbiont 'TC1' of Trimyema compressum]